MSIFLLLSYFLQTQDKTNVLAGKLLVGYCRIIIYVSEWMGLTDSWESTKILTVKSTIFWVPKSVSYNFESKSDVSLLFRLYFPWVCIIMLMCYFLFVCLCFLFLATIIRQKKMQFFKRWILTSHLNHFSTLVWVGSSLTCMHVTPPQTFL